MSPAKRKEKTIKIDKDRFKSILTLSKVKQKDIANMLYTSEAYFSRKIAQGEIDKDWMYKICDYLDVSVEYLTGESDGAYPRITDKYFEVQKIGVRTILNQFMIAYGVADGYCDVLTDDDLFHIQKYIWEMAYLHHLDFDSMVDKHGRGGTFRRTLDGIYEHDIQTEQFEKNMAIISKERSDKKESAAAKNKSKKKK